MNKQNKISLLLGVLVLTVLLLASSFAFFQITNTDSSTDTNFTGELEDINDYGKSVLSGGIEGYHINILASDMAPSKIGTHYYGTIDKDSNYSLERKNYEISNVSIVDGVNNENVAYTCTSELTITLKGSLTETKENGSYYIQEGDGTLYLSGDNLKIDKRQIDLKELIENAVAKEETEELTKEYKKILTYIISKGNNGTLNVDFDIINRDTIQNDIAGKNIEIILRNSNLQCEVSGRKVYANLNVSNIYRSKDYNDKIVSASFVDYVPSDTELENLIHWDLTNTSLIYGHTSPSNSVIGWLEATEENSEQYNLYIGSKDIIYAADLGNAFYGMTNLKEIKFVNLNTSETAATYAMFKNCSNLATLDLSSFDTSQVTNMNSMFYGLSVDLPFKDWPNFDTSSVTSMGAMFSGYQGATLDLSTFDTSKVTNMSEMFSSSSANITFPSGFGSGTINMSNMFYNYKGTSLDLSNFDTSKVTNMSYTFGGSYSNGLIANIIFPKNFGSSATNMSYMFVYYAGTTLDLSNLNTSSVKDMNHMFYYDNNLTSLDLSSFNTQKVTNMQYMFADSGISYLTATITFPQGFGSAATDMSYMFESYKGTALDLSTFDTSSVTNMSYMFSYSSANITFPQGFGSAATDMSYMFKSYKGTALDLSPFDTSSVTTMKEMFENAVTELLFPSNFGSAVTDMTHMFTGYQGTTLDLSGFDTSSVTTMTRMFGEYSGVNNNSPAIIFPKGFGSAATTMDGMFFGYGGNTLDLSGFDTSSVTNMSGMFYSSKVSELDLSSFDTSSVTNMNSMFSSCTNLTELKMNKATFDGVKTSGNYSEMFGYIYTKSGGKIDYRVPSTIHITVKKDQEDFIKARMDDVYPEGHSANITTVD